MKNKKRSRARRIAENRQAARRVLRRRREEAVLARMNEADRLVLQAFYGEGGIRCLAQKLQRGCSQDPPEGIWQTRVQTAIVPLLDRTRALHRSLAREQAGEPGLTRQLWDTLKELLELEKKLSFVRLDEEQCCRLVMVLTLWTKVRLLRRYPETLEEFGRIPKEDVHSEISNQ